MVSAGDGDAEVVYGVSVGDGCRELGDTQLTSKEWTEEERPGGGYRAKGGKCQQVRRACRPRIDGEAVRAPPGLSKVCNAQTSHVHRSRMLWKSWLQR